MNPVDSDKAQLLAMTAAPDMNSLLLPAGISVTVSPPQKRAKGLQAFCFDTWEFPKIRGTILGVLILRILLFRVLQHNKVPYSRKLPLP